MPTMFLDSGNLLLDRASPTTLEIPTTAGAVRLPGTSGNYLSTPDSVLSPTGDLDMRVKLSLDDWTPAANMMLISKRAGAPQASWSFNILTTGIPNFFWSYDGTNGLSTAASSAVSFANGTVGWVRVTLDVDNGSGQSVTTMYTSTDGVTWAVLGVPDSKTGTTNIADTTAPIEIGTRNGGTVDPLAGTVYYAEVRSGIDGPIVAKFDASQIQVSGATTPATINGWTLNGSALYKRDDYVRLPGTSGNYLSFPDTVTLTATDLDVRLRIDDADTSTTLKGVISKWAGSGQRSWMLRHASSAANRLEWLVSGNGSSVVVSQAALADTPTGTKWVRVTYDADNGAGNSVINFYTSPDGVTWTLLSGPFNAVVTTPFDSTAPLVIGTDPETAARDWAGNVYYAEVRNGINGTVVASFDARDIATPWTLNGAGWNWQGANVPARPVMALSLPGTSGNYASMPDTASLTVTDLDVRAKVALAAWPPAANAEVVSKQDTTGNQRSFVFRVLTDGTINYLSSAAGTSNTINVVSTVALTGAAGSTKWLRATHDVDNGAAGNTVSFYTSTDGAVWTPLGSPVVTGGTTGIFDSTAPLRVGIGDAGATNPLLGTVFYAEVRNGIDGPIVAEFHPSRVARTGTRTPTTMITPGGSPNLLTANEASIETDATGWQFSLTNTTATQDATQFLDGTKSLALTSAAVGDMFAGTATATNGKPVVGNKSYTVVASFKSATAARTVLTRIVWYNAAGSGAGTSTGSGVTSSTSAWTATSDTFVAPATAVFAAVQVKITAAAAAAEVHYVDRVSLVESAASWSVAGSSWDWVSTAA